jgi:hypothetical protein
MQRSTPSPADDRAALFAALPASLRAPHASEPLRGGQGGAQVVLLHYAWGDAVLKGPLRAREATFYRDVAPRFAEHDIAVPIVYAMIAHGGTDWLVREAFPQVLPMQRWFGDADVLRALHQIHALSTDFAIPDPYLPAWGAIAEPYRAVLPGNLPGQIAALAAQHADIFAPTTVIVGDPNTTNWGVRADGTVVLFDWEYIGYGTPARDLGSLIPQLGWPTLYEQLAASYLALTTPAPSAEQIHRFAHDMALARLQSIIEYVNAPEIVDDNRHYVLGLLPSWFAMINGMDAAFHARFG